MFPAMLHVGFQANPGLSKNKTELNHSRILCLETGFHLGSTGSIPQVPSDCKDYRPQASNGEITLQRNGTRHSYLQQEKFSPSL